MARECSAEKLSSIAFKLCSDQQTYEKLLKIADKGLPKDEENNVCKNLEVKYLALSILTNMF